jgi:outer membrane receptor protein involved in Fe transport
VGRPRHRPPHAHLSLTGAIDNLTDSDRMDPLGYPVLGRAFRFGVRARF